MVPRPVEGDHPVALSGVDVFAVLEKNLFDLSDQFNEKFPKLNFDVIEPGNVLMITEKN